MEYRVFCRPINKQMDSAAEREEQKPLREAIEAQRQTAIIRNTTYADVEKKTMKDLYEKISRNW